MKYTILFFSIMLLSGNILPAKTLSETFKKQMTFQAGNLLSLTNQNGDVQISTWNRNEIEIIAYKKVRASSSEEAEKMMQYLQIKIYEHEDEIEIETKHPSRNGRSGGFFDWLFGRGNGNSYSVEYEIKIPENADLNIQTTNGNINVASITGRLRLETTNGIIRADEITGLLRCHTTNGDIKVAIRKITREDEMHFKTTNGSIRLYLPEEFAGYVDLNTTNGNIDSDFPISSERYHKRTHVKGRIKSGDTDVYCSTTNGNIRLYQNN
jgi:hypothetical protein